MLCFKYLWRLTLFMKFRTEINFKKIKDPIEHDQKIITIGSCFAENIAGYFSQYRFNILEDPFSVLYNPASILNSLKLLRDKKKFTKDDFISLWIPSKSA